MKAIMLKGQAGVGKTSLAEYFAKSINANADKDDK